MGDQEATWWYSLSHVVHCRLFANIPIYSPSNTSCFSSRYPNKFLEWVPQVKGESLICEVNPSCMRQVHQTWGESLMYWTSLGYVSRCQWRESYVNWEKSPNIIWWKNTWDVKCDHRWFNLGTPNWLCSLTCFKIVQNHLRAMRNLEDL